MNLAALQILATVIPRIVEAIHFAEQIFPNAGSGPKKLELVLTRAQEIISSIPGKIEALLPVAEKVKPIVQGIVDVFNRLGIFQHGTANTASNQAVGVAEPDFSPGSKSAGGIPETSAPA